MIALSTRKEALYKLLRIAIGNEEDLSLPEGVNLADVMESSKIIGISSLAINGLQKITESGFDLTFASEKEEEQWMDYFGLSIKDEYRAKQQWGMAKKLIDFYAQNDIITVGLKGMTVAQWYPNPMLRTSCDFDCLLVQERPDGKIDFAYEEGNRLIEEKGIPVDRNIYVHSIFKYEELVVENHHYLAAVKLSRRYRQMDNLLRELLTSAPLQSVMNSKLMMGPPMFNAVFLLHHAHRHFLNEYLPMKLLVDWALFIKNNASLNWDRFIEYAEQFGMLRFAQSMTRLACRRLGTCVPFEFPEDEEADLLLEESMWAIQKSLLDRKSLLARHLGIVLNLLRAKQKFHVFYDRSSLQMIAAYVKGYLFEKEPKL